MLWKSPLARRIIAALALAAATGAVCFWGLRERQEPKPPPPPTKPRTIPDGPVCDGYMQADPPPELPAPAPESDAPPTLLVEIAGCVQRPGIYRLRDDSRVQHLIDRAGGITETGDLSDINPAARLIGGSMLTIPALPVKGMDGDTLVLRRTPGAAELNPPAYTRSGWQPSGPAHETSPANTPQQQGASPGTDGKVNLNRASTQELEQLPGIGPMIAERIITYRTQQPFVSVEDLMNVPGIGVKRLEALQEHVTAP